MKKNYKKLVKMTNAIDPAAPASVWGYKGCAGKGGATRNATIQEKKGGNANA
jgi:hypothetical protein